MNPLVTETTMSQLSQLCQDEALPVEGEVATYRLDETQAFSVLLPTFKKIVSVTDRNSLMLDRAFIALSAVYASLLAEVGEMCGESGKKAGDSTSIRFQSSNLPINLSRSNKLIRPIGEWESRK
jgi:hypothetical protein